MIFLTLYLDFLYNLGFFAFFLSLLKLVYHIAFFPSSILQNSPAVLDENIVDLGLLFILFSIIKLDSYQLNTFSNASTNEKCCFFTAVKISLRNWPIRPSLGQTNKSIKR